MPEVDVWGHLVEAKTSPDGNRYRVAYGWGNNMTGYPPNTWEIRVTAPEDDLSYVLCHQVRPGHRDRDLLRRHPDAYRISVEVGLVVAYDRAVAALIASNGLEAAYELGIRPRGHAPEGTDPAPVDPEG